MHSTVPRKVTRLVTALAYYWDKCRALMHACISSNHSPNPMPVLPLKMGHFLSRGTKTSLSVTGTLTVEGAVGGADEVDETALGSKLKRLISMLGYGADK